MFVSWLLLSQSPAFGQQKYYWSDKRQISLSEDKTEMSFTFKQSRQRESLREQVARVADVAKVVFSRDGQFGSVSFKNAQSDDALKSAKKVGLDTADIDFASFGYKFENKHRLSTSHRIVLRPKKGVSIEQIAQLTKKECVFEKTEYDITFFKAIKKNVDLFENANKIYESGLVEYCHPDFFVEAKPTSTEEPQLYAPLAETNRLLFSSDPLYPQQWNLDNSSSPFIDINAPQAWGVTLGSGSIRVAVIDDGIDEHEDLGLTQSDIGWTAPRFYDPAKAPGRVVPNAVFSHGISCAGIIAALHNNKGIKGIAPNVKIVPVNVRDIFYSNVSSEIAAGLNWSWQLSGGNVDVISASLDNIPVPVDVVESAIFYARTSGRGGKGCIVVRSAGNKQSPVTSPNQDGIIIVGSLGRDGVLTTRTPIDHRVNIVAPSRLSGDQDDDIFPALGLMGIAQDIAPPNYKLKFGGTSAACPQVAAVAALVLSRNPNLWEYQVRDILYSKARFISSQPGYGAGLVDAFKSLPLVNIALSGTTYLPSGSGTWTATPYEGAYPFTYTWQLRYPNDPWFDVASTGCTNTVTLTPPSHGSFRIRAKVNDANGRTGYSSEIFVDNGTGGFFGTPSDSVGIADKLEFRSSNQPVTFSLQQNYPNPFNPTTIIRYSLATSEKVSLKVYDVLGRVVADLVESEKAAGTYQVVFKGENLSSGVYFYRLQAGAFVKTKRMMLTK